MNENGLKDRLRTIAKEQGITFNECWKELLLERFLARLSASKHKDKFIFKGGLLLAQYLELGRETADIDFSATKMRLEAEPLRQILEEILDSEIDDGFIFAFNNIEALNQPHMEYAGFRIVLSATFAKMKDSIEVDIAAGDLVTPKKRMIWVLKYKGVPLFDGDIALLVYPPETIFSEKLETLIRRGALNSRMKDYHDLILLCREANLLDESELKSTILKTFDHRGTILGLPVSYDSGELRELQAHWSRHLRGLGPKAAELGLPADIGKAVDEINQYLTHVFN